MDFEADYLTKQIIAYIGNKRKLLFLIDKAIKESGIKQKKGLKFADLFCGSGVVSRFAKYCGYEVYCNDWEEYAYTIAKGFIKTNKKDIKKLFGGETQFLNFLNKINTLKNPDKDNQYISKYYAPQSEDINKADYTKERLFYTRENALAIDKIRDYIEQNFNTAMPEDGQKKDILTACLLYEAATHTNTSGVFKAFHKEFGGHGKDALKRILTKIQLNPPVLIDSNYPVHVYNEDANSLVKMLPEMDIVYLDPPYNQHQYGSNYHMLNTIAKWDKIPEPLELNEKGILKNKAGIREDWIKTRSSYCYKDTAPKAFENLIQNINAKLILISYSSDGIIPFEEMKRICLSKGYVSIVTSDYTTYRGGKQSNKRVNSDIEFILVIDTTKKAEKSCEEKIDKIIVEKKILMTLKRKFCEKRMNNYFEFYKKEEEHYACVKLSDTMIEFLCVDKFTLSLTHNLQNLSIEQLNQLLEILEKAICHTKEEELDEILRICRTETINKKKYVRMIPGTLKKLAQKKYKEIYYQNLKKLEIFADEDAALYEIIKDKIKNIKSLAEIRFNT